MRQLISSGSTFEHEIGYSRAVVVGEWIFVSGTTGFNYATMTIEDDVVAQAEQTLRNIEDALTKAGASLADVVRVHYILPSATEFPRCWPALRKAFGEIRPAATMIEAGLSDPRMKIEIEVTALRDTKGTKT
jgi:enamine deaminase RidA (YjgF/YER057c/UK114 family)